MTTEPAASTTPAKGPEKPGFVEAFKRSQTRIKARQDAARATAPTVSVGKSLKESAAAMAINELL